MKKYHFEGRIKIPLLKHNMQPFAIFAPVYNCSYAIPCRTIVKIYEKKKKNLCTVNIATVFFFWGGGQFFHFYTSKDEDIPLDNTFYLRIFLGYLFFFSLFCI